MSYSHSPFKDRQVWETGNEEIAKKAIDGFCALWPVADTRRR